VKPSLRVKPGAELPELRKAPISKVQLVMYAGASGDYNLIHTDVETARDMGLGGVIAHGMLSMGFLGEYAAAVAGPEKVMRLKVRFAAMVRLGDVLTCRGRVKEVEDGRATIELWAENEQGDRVTTGEAEVEIG
jgi:acyl dehydratase